MADNINNLFDFIKSRLPTGYGYGLDNQTVDENYETNHDVYNFYLREDHPGDVCISEYIMDYVKSLKGFTDTSMLKSNVQVSVICTDGDVYKAVKFMRELYSVLNTNNESGKVYIRNCQLVNITPSGQNKNGLQVVIANYLVSYYMRELEDEETSNNSGETSEQNDNIGG